MTKFSVPDMSCGHCTAAIEKTIKTADSRAEVICNIGDHTVTVNSALAEDALKTLILEAGYEAATV